MTRKSLAAAALASLVLFPLITTQAQASCGVIQEQAQAKRADQAVRKADRAVRNAVRSLRREHGRKLVLSEVTKSCVGGALAVDEKGNETIGPSSCTVTQPFCINP